MTDVERQIIFDEIDRRVADCKIGSEFWIKHELLEMKEFIKNMNTDVTESDEKEIDAAAEEYGTRQGIEDKPFAIRHFKAGVMWILKKGITVKGKLLDGFLYTHFGDRFFDMGEKTRIDGAPTEGDAIDVTVQIR